VIRLREYQEAALAAEAAHRAEHPDETRLAIVMATGLGKGMIIAARAARFAEDEHDRFYRADEAGVVVHGGRQRVLILTHTDELTADLAARCRLMADQSEFPITVGLVKADADETNADIIVASPQTLLQPGRRERITDVGLVIVDECELYVAPQWQDILHHYGCFAGICPQCWGSGDTAWVCPGCAGDGERPAQTPLLGFTATLERSDGRGLGALWQNVCFSRDISWGVRHGYLVQPVGYRLEIDPGHIMGNGTTMQTPGGRFAENVANLDGQLIDCLAPEKIVEKWLELAVDRPTIAFMPLVRSARVLANAFHAAGVPAAVVYGDMPVWQRKEALEDYDSGKVQVLVNAMVLTRGFDAPKTSCVIVGRPTKSRNLGIQMAGRGLRPVPGIPVEDQDCILIYVQDATTDLFTHADLSDRPLDREATGALTAMEDAWDIGVALEEETRHWAGKVSTTEFDPLVRRSSKVWKTTKGGTLFLPVTKDGQYVFVVGTSVFMRERFGHPAYRTVRLHKDLPDLDIALQVAEDEATDRGGDVGALLADRSRPWRKAVPSGEMVAYAHRLGLQAEINRILTDRAGGKAGKVSDLIARVEATRAIDPLVARIKEASK
jgi:superfamily II DNA or RNA helicase